MNIFQKLTLGFSTSLATFIPLVFSTSCSTNELQPVWHKAELLDNNKAKALISNINDLYCYNLNSTIHNQQLYKCSWESGVNSTWYAWEHLRERNGDHTGGGEFGTPTHLELDEKEYGTECRYYYIDPLKSYKGINIIHKKFQFNESSYTDRDAITFDPFVFNLKTPHPEITFRLVSVRKKTYVLNPDFKPNNVISHEYQDITIPAYDGIGKSIGNWANYAKSIGSKNLYLPWLSVWQGENNPNDNWYEVFGPWYLHAPNRPGLHLHDGCSEKTLCSTRIISLPPETKKIHENAFNLEQILDCSCIYESWSEFQRPVASEAFRKWVYGTEDNPDGLWCKLQFEGNIVSKENIGQGAFYHCWSLEKSLASYYGEDIAYSMVHNGTH